ncbi:hydantoinase/oxoprolinase N-terminal domain-containing protein [Dankookia sp. P2]|uniref:hydantoinase/oxoprolinase N-terminal domain-containing protein n=1 Tax=Dankookia sp. P2 TaxID=3423955 RepID=UPI003D668F29
MSGSWQFWIDRGGTFTDIVARDPRGAADHRQAAEREPRALPRRRRRRHPPDPGRAARRADPARHDREAVKMGTTVATNALLERKGERVLLLVNRGFADLLRYRQPGPAAPVRPERPPARPAA